MTAYESVLFSVVVFYTLLFLVRPAPGLTKGEGAEAPTPKVETAERVSIEKHPAVQKERELPPTAQEAEAPAPAAVPQPERVEPPPVEPEPAVAVETPAPEAPPEPEPPQLSWVERLRQGLAKTGKQMFAGVDALFTSKETKVKREAALEAVFETLIRSDVGVRTTDRLVDAVRERLAGDDLEDVSALKLALREEMLAVFEAAQKKTAGPAGVAGFEFSSKHHVVMVVGVNGVGKTTTTGKMARLMRDKGAQVVVGAADTFRAAAVDQLKVWAERSQATFVTFKEGADPASVAFEAVKKASEVEHDSATVCFVDTAGRLHNRADLMEELAKVRRVMDKALPGAPHEVLLVVDATTGQNAIQQAKTFLQAVKVDGLVVTKLDGTAKGGVALAIAGDLGLPIRFVGVGEAVEDLQPFDAPAFVDALFDHAS